MNETIVNKVFSFIMLALFIFIAYSLSIVAGEKLAVYVVGSIESNLYKLIISIFLTSCIVFMITLIIHYIYQLIPFLRNEQFVRMYHGIHLIFLYVSGLITVIVSIEPTLLSEGIINSPLNYDTLSISFLIFFIILSNYGIYNSIVLNNEFKFIHNKRGANKYLSFKFIYQTFEIFVSIILIIRLIANKRLDEVSLLLFALVNAPHYYNRFFCKK